MRQISHLHESALFTIPLKRLVEGVGWGGGGGGGVSESIKKGKLLTKTFFQIMLNEVLKICGK